MRIVASDFTAKMAAARNMGRRHAGPARMTLPPDTAALVEQLNSAVREVAEKYAVKVDGQYRYGEDGKASITFTHAEWRLIAPAIEAQARRIEELTTGLQTIADAEFVDVMCDPGWAIRYSKDTLARANGARDEGEGADAGGNSEAGR